MRTARHRFLPAVEGFERRDVPSAVSMAPAHVAAPRVSAAELRERAKLTRRDFPDLGRDYDVLAPSSDRYNCIAHALGLHDRWVTPVTGPARARLSWADRVFAKAGYTRLDSMDFGLSPGERKVVLYGYTARDGTLRELRHAALQSPDGTWTSKLGHWALIRHADPYSVAGPLYGRPIAVYARPA